MSSDTCTLALEDGTVFRGIRFGSSGTVTGEAVFNTAMTGYQEVLTDPSYLGQIVTMTYPLIGNYGVNRGDVESKGLHLSALVVRELPPLHSNFRAEQRLDEYLQENGIVGMYGIDTRALTRRLRQHGSLRAAMTTDSVAPEELIEQAQRSPQMSGQNLAARVSGQAPESWTLPPGVTKRYSIVALDCGIKFNILRALNELGCEVIAMSGLSPAEAVLERNPDGVLVGNGPGDPQVVDQSIETVRQLLGKVPLFGICLGHQLLACASNAEIYKLKFGHHGANHPVLNTITGQVEITSQNHGFAVDEQSLARVGCYQTHKNLNDQSLEGFAHQELPVFAVQYHPEAAPGPHDSHYLFGAFLDMLETKRLPLSLRAT